MDNMKYPRYLIGLKRSIATKKARRRNLIKQALRGSSKPYTLKELQELAPWNFQSFTADIPKVFSGILNLVLEGHEILDIEAAMGLPRNWLNNFFHRYKELGETLREARRSIKTDKIRMSEMKTDSRER